MEYRLNIVSTYLRASVCEDKVTNSKGSLFPLTCCLSILNSSCNREHSFS